MNRNEDVHYEAWSVQLDFTGKQREIEHLMEDKKRLHARVAELLR